MGEPIEVHVFGGKKGESIVVRLPGGLWGVVDSYWREADNPRGNPAVSYLEGRGVKRLKFVCLTHPHDDHFRGMGYILEEFDPDDIWVFGSASHADLREKVAAVLKVQALVSNFPRRAVKVGELVRILDLIRDKWRDKKRSPRVNVVRLQLEQPLLRVDSTPPVTVTATGASGGAVMVYEESLNACFRSGGDVLAQRVTGVNHNLISGGLLIEYGTARIILGGDMERDAWQEAVCKFEASGRLASTLVKVSHHGSSNGYCAGLWAKLSPNKSAVAVLTPYVSQGLPSPEGLQEVQTHSKTTFATSVSGVALSNDWVAGRTAFTGLSVEALIGLQSVFPTAHTDKDRLNGRCSFFVTETGAVTWQLDGEGGELK